ncbi:MAG TPA: hypothetical protein VM325_20140 [Alphaproteobacteria bacterium]|nr:hypothetical protein [Alphaproteobacteria bacterium]
MGHHLKRLREHSERQVQRMDADTAADGRLVMDAAAALDIREFDVFMLAYQRRFERDPLPDRIEDIFARYMFVQEAPAYVRQFAREALAQAQSGALDPAAFGVPPKPHAGPDRRGPLMVWGVLGLTVSFCWLLIVTPADAGRDGRLFCDRGTGSAFIGTVARSISDRPNPLGCRR